MCIDPLTMMASLKAAGTAITAGLSGTLGTVATVGGGILSAYSMHQQGKAANAAAQETAKAQDAAALQTMEAADREDLLMRKRFAQQEGGNKVALAASGVDVNSAGALELLGENRREFEEDALVIRTNAQRSANSQGLSAAATRQEGLNAKSAGTWGAVGSILSTASRVGDRYKKRAGQKAYQRGLEG